MEYRPQSVSGTLRRRQLYPMKAWARITCVVAGPRQLPAMLAINNDVSSAVKSAAKATADASTRSLDNARSTT